MRRSPLKTKPNREKASERALQAERDRRSRKDAKDSARFAEQYHSDEFVRWIHQQECCTPSPLKQCNYWPTWQSVASHLAKDKSAGGTWQDVAPQCTGCHTELHGKGPVTFCQARGWPLERLSELAAGYAAEWEAISQP